MPTYLTVAEIAAQLNVDRETVVASIRAGHLQAVNVARPGGKRPIWRIIQSDLEGFLAARRGEAVSHG